jgi:caa(3)-type oxidase subunit IV
MSKESEASERSDSDDGDGEGGEAAPAEAKPSASEPAKGKKGKKKRAKASAEAGRPVAKEQAAKEAAKEKVAEKKASAEDDHPREATSERPSAQPRHASPGAHAEHGHHKPDRKQYVKIWVVLLVLTLLEVGVVYTGVSKIALVTALVGMALAKAACVALYYMHLKHETKVMRWTVAFPVVFPALYAFILIAEGMYRALWGDT